MNTKSLQFKLSALIIATSIVVVIISEIVVVMMTQDMISAAHQEIRQKLRETLAMHLQAKSDIGITNAANTATMPALINALASDNHESVRQTIQAISENIKKHTDYRGIRIHILDRDLKTISRNWMEDNAGEDFAHRHSLQQVKKSGKAITAFEAGPYGVTLRAIAPIQTQSGEFVGIISLQQGMGSVSRLFEKEGHRMVTLVRAELVPDEPNMDGWAFSSSKIYPEASKAFIQSLNLKEVAANPELSTGEWEVTTVPLTNNQGEEIGMHVLAAPSSFLDARLAEINKLTLALGATLAGALIFLSLGIIVMVRRAVVTPARKLQERMQKLSEGDFTVHFDNKHRDEIGLVSRSAAHMAEQTAKTFSQAQQAAQALYTSAQSLSQQATELAHQSEENKHTVDITSNSVNALTEEIRNVAQSALKVQAKTRDTDAIVGDGHKIVQQTRTDMEMIAQSVQTAADKVTRLNTSTDQVESIVQTIKDIADQTNLLALNAAIEAARAGETGRGFAVVADEVRKLAEKTIIATDEINNMVQGIQNSTHSVVSEMQDSLAQVEQGQRSAGRASEALENIRNAITAVRQEMDTIQQATETQENATRALGQSMDAMASSIEQSVQAVNETQQIAHTVHQHAETLEKPLSGLRLP